MSTIEDGDEVLIHEPAWLSYQEHVRLVDAKPTFIPFNTPVTDFGSWITHKTGMIIINNPNNPAGRIYSSNEIENLVNICLKNNIWLLVDEAYSDFVKPGLFKTALDYDQERKAVIVANSLSKNMGMSGWRIGYLIAHSDLIKCVLKLNQHIITCAPTILQSYLAKYFDQIIEITLPQAQDVINKRKIVENKMSEIGIDYLPGNSTFYFFVDIGEFSESTLDLSLYLLLYHNIATVPGSAYGESTERYLRLSIGTETLERIYDALLVIHNTIHSKFNIKEKVLKKLKELNIPTFELNNE